MALDRPERGRHRPRYPLLTVTLNCGPISAEVHTVSKWTAVFVPIVRSTLFFSRSDPADDRRRASRPSVGQGSGKR